MDGWSSLGGTRSMEKYRIYRLSYHFVFPSEVGRNFALVEYGSWFQLMVFDLQLHTELGTRRFLVPVIVILPLHSIHSFEYLVGSGSGVGRVGYSIQTPNATPNHHIDRW